MYKFMEYAARIRPYVAVFESVQQAFSGGRDLMQLLRDRLEYLTGDKWGLYHVKHNAISVGGAAIRRRYFWVASRIPFGVETYQLKGVPTLFDVIGDLTDLDVTWLPQPYRAPHSYWLRDQQMVSGTGFVDGHATRWTPYTRRAMDLVNGDKGVEWLERENISTVARRYYERHGELPESWNATSEKIINADFHMGYNQLTRWRKYGAARVVTGSAMDHNMHPDHDRPMTHREIARIMGFPDDWRIEPLRRISGLHTTWGKGITVQCGRWIGEWIRRSIEGNPGSDSGTEIGEREYLIDHTNHYREFTTES